MIITTTIQGVKSFSHYSGQTKINYSKSMRYVNKFDKD